MWDIIDSGNGTTNSWDDVLKTLVGQAGGAIFNAISGQRQTPVPAAVSAPVSGAGMGAYMPLIVLGVIVLGGFLLLKD